MIIVKHDNTYMCEVCNFEHSRKGVAEYCEHSAVTAPVVRRGDKVLVESRYDGFIESTVLEVSIRHNKYFNFNNTPSVFAHYITKKTIPLKESMRRTTPHEVVVTLGDSVEVCKDGTCSDVFCVDEIILGKNLRWWDDLEMLPSNLELVFIKYIDVDGDQYIRRGDKKWFHKYHGDCNFIAWAENNG